MLIGAISSFVGKGLSPLPSPTVPAYEQIQKNISNLLALWTEAEDSGTVLTDVQGTRHGTYTGTPVFSQADFAPGSVGGAVNYGGLASASIPHDSGLALSAFTISRWFKFTALPAAPEFGVIISKDQSGLVAGDFAAYVNDDGTLFVSFQTALAEHSVSLSNAVVAGEAYHLIVRADGTGFDALLNGRYLGKNTDFTDAWSANTQPIRLATAPWTAVLANYIGQHTALYSRVLTETECLGLAGQTSLPIAVEDVADVPQNATTNIAVLNNDLNIIGLTPTVAKVTNPGSPDSVVVAADGKSFDFTAGAAAADRETNFQYRPTTVVGPAVTAGVVRVRVQATTPPVVANANCYRISEVDTVTVSSMADLQSAINAAPPGRQIKIASGTYAGGTLSLDPRGTAANPIVVRPSGARGSVTINSPVWTLLNTSSRLVIANLHLNSPGINVSGDNHRVSRCQIRSISRGSILIVAGRNTRVDHCDVAGYTNSTGNKAFVRMNDNEVAAGSSFEYLIDYNYCHDVTPTLGANGQDFIGFSDGTGCWNRNPGLVIDHNRFENLVLLTEGELVGAKTRGIKFRFNTCINIPSNWCYINAPRMGDLLELRSNWFENIDYADFCMVRSDNALVIGNRFVGSIPLRISSGQSYWGGTGTTLESNFDYKACRNARVIGNILDSGLIHVGHENYQPANAGPYIPVLNTNLHNNTRTAGGSAHVLLNQSGTTFNSDSEAFVPAVRLATTDVGLSAPDPLCPSGPQS